MKKPMDAPPTWDKVDLENALFLQAQKEGAYLCARLGKIYQKGGSALLRALLGVYNHFFASQNRRFVRETCDEGEAEQENFIQEYQKDKQRMYIRPIFHLPGLEKKRTQCFINFQNPLGQPRRKQRNKMKKREKKQTDLLLTNHKKRAQKPTA